MRINYAINVVYFNIKKYIINFRIKKLKIEQILESRIIIDTFFKAIIAFDDNLINLNKEKIIDFCMMKDKYVL